MKNQVAHLIEDIISPIAAPAIEKGDNAYQQTIKQAVDIILQDQTISEKYTAIELLLIRLNYNTQKNYRLFFTEVEKHH